MPKLTIPSPEELKKEDSTRLFEKLKDENFRQQLTRQTAPYRAIKRVLDIIAASALLILLSPAWLLLAIAVRINSHGHPIFAQQRVGLNGRPFTIYKYRTMRSDVAEQDHAPTALSDPRITTIGRFLRRTSLDEIPQLWNVIKGDMSMVGPRPEMAFIADNYTEYQQLRLLAKPGITGLWQVAGRKDLPLHENVEHDLYYIINQSFWLDLIIFLKTFTVVLSGKGAY